MKNNMHKSVIIHILNECNLACNLCYACSPKRLDPIKKDEIEDLVKKGFLIKPSQLSKTIFEIPKKYAIYLRGGEVSLYPNWDDLFLSFAKSGYKINIDTNGQWVPKSEKEINKQFYEILKNIKHQNITIYFSYDKWHEKKDKHLKERTKIFIKYAKKYELNFFIFATGLQKKELREYYKDLNLDFKKEVRFNPNIYKLGRRKNDPNAVEYCNYKENENLVINPNGDVYPDLQASSEKNSTLKLGNIKLNSIGEILTCVNNTNCNNCKFKIPFQTKKDLEKNILLKGWGFTPQEIENAWNCGKLLNASIETSNICDLNCEYCFRQETDQITKKRLPGEISLEQTYKIIDDVTELGAKSIYIIGAGEPLLDDNLKNILKYIAEKNIIPIISTNGSQINEKWIRVFQKYNVSIVIKLNSFNSAFQDELANRKGYAKKRDKGLSLLLKAGFNKPIKDKDYQTRLAINSIVCQKNKKEILDIFKYCRDNNIMPIMSTFIPAGKTEHCTDLEISLKEFLELSKKTRKLDKKYGINYKRLLPYLGGVPCSQNGKASIYITILGDIYECPGQQHDYGNINSTSVKKVFNKIKEDEANFDFGCPPRITYWKNTNQLIDDFKDSKKAWKSTIPADDLDKHMLATKQVQANVKILEKMLNDFPIKEGTNILVPGCGTGQIFDYIDINLFSNYHLTLTDINKEYLKKIDQRFKKNQKISYKIIEDDIEIPKIQQKFDSSILILVLEHIEWKKALENILNLGVNSVYIIIQKQDKNKQIVTSYKNIPKSITKFSTITKSQLIDEHKIKQYFKKNGFNLLKSYSEKIMDNREMIGLFLFK